MNVVLHCGLHKTGTSSLQGMLYDQFGVPTPDQPFFPRPTELGPGHTFAIQEACGLQKEQNFDQLDQWMASARSANASHLVISSEDIYTADPQKLSGLLAHLSASADRLIVITTISPYVRRFRSSYIELIKHGHQGELQSSYDTICKFPSLDNNLISSYLDVVSQYQNAFIVSGSGTNTHIGQQFYSAAEMSCECALLHDPANKSIDEFETGFGVSSTDISATPKHSRTQTYRCRSKISYPRNNGVSFVGKFNIALCLSHLYGSLIYRRSRTLKKKWSVDFVDRYSARIFGLSGSINLPCDEIFD